MHRWVFLAASLYNIGWGVHSVIDPQWLFRFAKMPEQNDPKIFACLGMVVRLYGILYLEVARDLEKGWLLTAVGLLGKLLGPVGWLYLFWSGRWPIETVVLCLTNDLIVAEIDRRYRSHAHPKLWAWHPAHACIEIPMPVFGYCLMPSHFHLVVLPVHNGDLSRFILHCTQAISVCQNHDPRGRFADTDDLSHLLPEVAVR